MIEKEDNADKKSLDFELQSVKVKRSIGDPIKKYIQRRRKKLSIFLHDKIPSGTSNFKSWVTSFRGGIILVCLISIIVIPLLLDESIYYHYFMLAMIYAIYAASWDLLSGVTGQVSFGHAAFFGIGGYACGAAVYFLNFHWFSAVVLGGIYAVVFGLLIAIPCLRFKGPYFALGTLSFSLLLVLLFSMSSFRDLMISILGPIGTIFGESGSESIIDFLLIDEVQKFVWVLLIMISAVVTMLIVYNSKLGTIFKAIRDDETSTEASGINVVKYKIYAFMISAFFAGIAGGIYILHLTKVDPGIFMPLLSFLPVIMACLGGIALISGAVFGAYFYSIVTLVLHETISQFFPAFSELFTNFAVFLFAIILLLIVRFTERGLMEPAIKQSKSLWDLVLGK